MLPMVGCFKMQVRCLSAPLARGTSRLFSLIGRLAYNYAGKYYLTFTARDDVSSKFAKGKRAAFFPSVGFSYRLSEEKFMKGVSHIFDNIKLRYSYGASGNQAISSYQTFAIMVQPIIHSAHRLKMDMQRMYIIQEIRI